MNSIREVTLENGLTVRFYDTTRRYYGDYFRVTLDIVCEVPLLREYFADEKAHEESRALLGTSAVYRRSMVQMGVPAAGVEQAMGKLVENFTDNSLLYFASSTFPRKLVLAETDRARRKTHRSYTDR